MSSGSWAAFLVPVPAQRGHLLGQAGVQDVPGGAEREQQAGQIEQEGEVLLQPVCHCSSW